MDCKTPSNPLGLEKGHNIPQGSFHSHDLCVLSSALGLFLVGEVLDIYEILERTGGSLSRV